MTRLRWLVTSLAIVATTAPSAVFAEEAPRALGRGAAYDSLAKLAVLHEGRIKPLDTLAREEVRQIFGRETIKLVDDTRENVVVETWGPTAAMLDWAVRPEFWDDQPIILVEYLPLKRLIMAESIRSTLEGIASRTETKPADRDAIRSVAGNRELSASDLKSLLARTSLTDADQKQVKVLAAQLAEEHKWLSPRQIEEAKLASGSDPQPWNSWFQEVAMKKRKADTSATGDVRLNEIEKRGYEVGTRLVHYQALRDRSMRSVEPMQIMPRPSSKTYLEFLGKTYEKARKSGNVEELSPLELDGAKALDTYWNELAIDERAVPGTDPKFDEKFSDWLRGSSAWVPLRALLDSKVEDLAAVGYPADKAEAFLKAFKELDQAEDATPGTVDETKTAALVAAARALGESVNPTGYPTTAAINRETYFNASSPFWKAQWAYMLATALLGACIGFLGFERRSALSRFGRGLYVGGMLGLVAGIVLEVQGFYLRVLISGWAPVTNMYETVIWVSLVSAVMGLILEGMFRKVFPALAGSAVALLGTVLAANVPLLDPNIHQLQPVLRSNYWLTIHVLTEVSSYGAFLMAGVLGLIATLYYLTATYRRNASIPGLLSLIVPGLLLFGTAGILTYAAGATTRSSTWLSADQIHFAAYVNGCIGGMLILASLASVAGELIARATFRDRPVAASAVAVAAPQQVEVAEPVAVGAGVGAESSGRASSGSPLARPTVAEIRAMAALQTPRADARTIAMQETAAKIKPISDFIYRTMQVGVLLIAAGTILGGIWADYSWGRFWGWDPKEVWALITLLVYLIPLHGRFAGWINTFKLVVASVVCSMSVIFAWYGVNFFLGVGLHSYGFVEGGGQGVVMAVCFAVLSLPLAAIWRRQLTRQVPAVGVA
ncbi:MAG: cytochrome c biogenesis protein CcsA [Isosphaeraceae bacterium]